MIQANELRIGNYIQYYDVTTDELKVDALMSYQIYNFDIKERGGKVADYYETIKPIPLTEEWLLKFGFELKKGKWVKWKMDLICDEPNVYSFDESRIYLDIKHVHQLQNLYFALTEEELTIK